MPDILGTVFTRLENLLSKRRLLTVYDRNKAKEYYIEKLT